MTEQQIRSINMGGVRIPEHMIHATLRYFNDHIEPGGFLCALLENDFIEACGRADEQNLAALPAWAALLYTVAPPISHGSPERVKAWLDARVR